MVTLKETVKMCFCKPEEITNELQNYYRTVRAVIIGVHLFGFSIAALLAYCYRSWNNQTAFFVLMCGFLQLLSIASGFLIVMLSLRSEVLVTQTNKNASSVSQATSHTFKSFDAQFQWLRENLSPRSFSDSQTLELSFTVSTPLYGIGVDAAKARIWVDYFKNWVEHFETMEPDNPSAPKWEITFWETKANIAVFKHRRYNKDWAEKDYPNLIEEFAALLQRVFQLAKTRRVDVRLYLSAGTHARLFMAHAGARYSGLAVYFTPLTDTAVEFEKWRIIGYSVREAKAYEDMARFNWSLHFNDDHQKVSPDNHVSVLADARGWLRSHYGLEKPQQAGEALKN
jgi:hypothetical protein